MHYCMQESHDQIHMLKWARESPLFSDYINKTSGTGLVGHSMGGGATVGSASNASAIGTHDIKVAVAMHPTIGMCST